MYLLDTDHLSLVARGGIAGQRIVQRLSHIPPSGVAITIITCEEQIRGWLSEIASSRSPERQVTAYREFGELLERYCHTRILPFGPDAALLFGELVRRRVRIGTMDLKIAAIALIHDATLLSRNISHFEKVPRLRVENWAD